MTKPKTEKASNRATMSDVAKRAGVSQATVSMVLNETGGTRVTQKTRDAVRKAAEEVGYQIWRRSAVGSGSLQVIGFVIDDSTSNPLVNRAVDAARQLAWENDAVLVVLPTQNDERLRASALELLMAHRVVGVVFSAFFTREYRLPQKLASVPVVLINCHAKHDVAPSILPAHAKGAEAAVDYIAGFGHQRIAFINGESWMEASKERLLGYKRGLKKADLTFDPELILQGNWTLSGGYQATKRILELENRPTAIFCASDEMAIGCYEAIKEAGLRIPRDISVVGFDDVQSAKHLEPALTTVRVPHDDMGHRAITHLFAKRAPIGTPGVIIGRIQIECPLIKRNSVAEPPT